MSSAIVSSASVSATSADGCRKHADIPTPFGSLAEALTPFGCLAEAFAVSPHQSIEEHPPTLKVHEHAGHFDCSICLDVCHDPVVTLCGHLFCWPCLFYWLSLHSVSKECPVCKADVEDEIVPLYGRGRSEHSMDSAATMFPDIKIPCRPLHSRSNVSGSTNAIPDHDGQRNHAIHTMNARQGAPSGNVGLFASMLGCGMTSLPAYNGGFFRGWARNGTSMLTQRQRFNNEKEFVLYWAFIFIASIAIVCFIFC